MDRVAVLGRGESLKAYRDYAHLFKRIYIVNNFREDIENIKTAFRGKEIIHVASRKGPNYLTKQQYKTYNVVRVQSNAFKTRLIENAHLFYKKPVTMPEFMNDRGYAPIGWSAILVNKVGAKILSPNKRCWPTTGLLAIDLALMENKLKEIYLFGFDFYEKPYLTGLVKKQDPAKVEMMKQHLSTLKVEFKDTKFIENPPIDESRWHTVKTMEYVPTQMKKERFNRMDIIARYLAIENHFGKNDFGWKIYRRMQRIRMKDNPAGARKKVKEFIKLIKSVEKNGFLHRKPIRIKENMELINGSHRIATALYFNAPELLLWVDKTATKKVAFSIKWFRKNGFKQRYIDAIEAKAKEVLNV